MRIAIVGHTASLSGGELALVRVLPALQTPDRQVTVVLGEDGPLAAAVTRTGAEVRMLPMDSQIRHTSRAETSSLRNVLGMTRPTVKYVRALRRFLLDHRIDVVHTNTLKAALYGGLAGRAAGLPVLWHIRDRIADDYLPRRTTTLVRGAARVLPQQIAVNSATTASTLPGSLGTRVHLVPDCVDAPALAARRARPATKSRSRPFTIGMMGRLAPWKGQDVALEAFVQAFGSDADVRLVFVGNAMFGEDDYHKALQGRAAALGVADRVVFRGFREDIWGEYSTFDVAVHASVVPEPFGQVVIEAMAAGVPVIASAAGGPAEVIKNGWDGLLVTPGDASALASALVRLDREPALRDSLATNGYATAGRYRPEETAKALHAIYDLLARAETIKA